MRNLLIRRSVGAASVSLLSAALLAFPSPQAGSQPASSAPDLTGVWLVEKFQPNMLPDVNKMLTPWGEAQRKNSDTLVNDPNLACLPHGVPRIMYVPLPMEIMQIPGRVLIYQEALNQLRHIHLDRQHPKDLDPTYNGDSVGSWEGDTLVVDTIGFNDVTWLDHAGLRHSQDLHVVERIRRLDHDTLVDDFTIEDPKAFTRPWTAQQRYKLKPGWEIAEYVCDSNKYIYRPK